MFSTETIPKVVGADDPASLEAAKALYGSVVARIVPVSSTRTAELTKLLENIYRSVNIALVNELKMLCDRMGIDVWEVIDAAATKPFGYMPFYPGPGLGGHCQDGREYVFVQRGRGLEALRMEQLFDARHAYRAGDLDVVRLEGTDILSFDARRERTCLRPVTHVFRRHYPRRVTLRTSEGRQLTTTDGHPLIVMNGHGLEVRRARAVDGDCRLVVARGGFPGNAPAPFDLVDALKLDEERIRVTPRDGSWVNEWNAVRLAARRFGVERKDVARNNTIPLRAFLELERRGLTRFRRKELLLATGKGAAHTTVPWTIDASADLARLVGYYLSEGCITRDKSLRTRWTFGAHESELIEDLTSILRRLGLRYSVHRVKRWKAVQIKVSSNLFGRFMRDVLQCGSKSEEMSVPPALLGGTDELRRNVLTGILNGDGSVSFKRGTNAYRKNGRTYRHRFHTAHLSYFTSSPRLLQQACLLLHSLGLVPTVKKGARELRLYGEEQLRRARPLMKGEKGARLDRYLAGRIKPMPAKKTELHSGFAAVAPASLRKRGGGYVYSVEVPGTQTYVTSYGIVSHNCIPLDPFYLTWKAREFEFSTRFIELAGEINTAMPLYVVQRTMDALNERGKALRGARVLVLGIAYKRDVDDMRESPAMRVIELLRERGAEVSYHDPHVARVPKMRRYPGLKMESAPLTAETLRACDVALIVTDHRAVDYAFVVEHAPLVVDTRNATRAVARGREKIVKA
jgi:UDP-glucose 6-dehydrogenase